MLPIDNIQTTPLVIAWVNGGNTPRKWVWNRQNKKSQYGSAMHPQLVVSYVILKHMSSNIKSQKIIAIMLL